ncbi:hypothetical protein BSG18_57490 [Pseudomonas ogarae]|nr:hypothetical protein BSF43_58260 [Pseudomonas ogarae]PBJ16701.1 hypothetical protein BSG18_57490 [Pseudomonas ogarae]
MDRRLAFMALGRVHRLAAQVAYKVLRIGGAMNVTLIVHVTADRIVFIRSADAIVLPLLQQVTEVVVSGGQRFAASLSDVTEEFPALLHGLGQLEIRRLLFEVPLDGVVSGEHPLHAIALGSGFFGEQVKTVEGTLHRAHHCPSHFMLGGGAVGVGAGDLVQLVQAVALPIDVGAVTDEVFQGVLVAHFHRWLLEAGKELMTGDPWQVHPPTVARVGMTRVEVLDGFTPADRCLDLLDAVQAAHLLVIEAPTGTLLGGQDNLGHLTLGIEPELEARQRRATWASLGVQENLDLCVVVGAVDLQQFAQIIADRCQALAAVEANVSQIDLVPGGGMDLHGQGHLLIAAAADPQGFDQTGFVHDPIDIVAIVEEVEAVEFLFLDPGRGAAAGDLEGFAGGQGKDAVVGRELGQVEIPTDAES